MYLLNAPADFPAVTAKTPEVTHHFHTRPDSMDDPTRCNGGSDPGGDHLPRVV